MILREANDSEFEGNFGVSKDRPNFFKNVGTGLSLCLIGVAGIKIGTDLMPKQLPDSVTIPINALQSMFEGDLEKTSALLESWPGLKDSIKDSLKDSVYLYFTGIGGASLVRGTFIATRELIASKESEGVKLIANQQPKNPLL